MAVYKIYGKPNCAFCEKAKTLLNSRGIEFEYIDVSVDHEAYKMLVNAGFRSVPQIYETAGKYIGGFIELQKALG